MSDLKKFVNLQLQTLKFAKDLFIVCIFFCRFLKHNEKKIAFELVNLIL